MAGNPLSNDPRPAILEAVEASAAALAALSTATGGVFKERDLESVFVVALREVAQPILPSTGHPVDFAEWQPRVGRVDVVLKAKSAPPHAFIELKWGAGTLYNCIWDTAKMAAAIAGSHVERGFLVAGARTAEFDAADGCEFFTDGTWDPLAHLFQDAYRPHWKKWWHEVKTRPQLLPTVIETRTVASAAMTIAGAAWTLAASEVRVTGTGWTQVPTCAEDFGEACSCRR